VDVFGVKYPVVAAISLSTSGTVNWMDVVALHLVALIIKLSFTPHRVEESDFNPNFFHCKPHSVFVLSFLSWYGLLLLRVLKSGVEPPLLGVLTEAQPSLALA
jgi:hypothetical protein